MASVSSGLICRPVHSIVDGSRLPPLRGVALVSSSTAVVVNNWREVKTYIPEVKASPPHAKRNWRSYAKRARQLERLRTIGMKRLQTIIVDKGKGQENFETKGLTLTLPHFLNWLKSATYVLNVCAREPACAKKVKRFLQNNLIGQFSKLDPVVAFFDLPSDVYAFPKVTYISIEKAAAHIKHQECYFSKAAYALLKSNEWTVSNKADVDALVRAAAQSGIPWEYTLEGCQLRAQILAEALEFMGVDSDKIFLQYHMGKNLLNDWVYHVAVAIITEENELLILDPSLNEHHSMTVTEWVTKCNGVIIFNKNYYLALSQEIDRSKVSTFYTTTDYVLEYEETKWSLVKARENEFKAQGKHLRVSVEAASIIGNLKRFSHLAVIAKEFNINPFELSMPTSWSNLEAWVNQSCQKVHYEPFLLNKAEIAALEHTQGMEQLNFNLDEAISRLEFALDYCRKSIEAWEVPTYTLDLARESNLKLFREKSEALSNKIAEFGSRQAAPLVSD